MKRRRETLISLTFQIFLNEICYYDFNQTFTRPRINEKGPRIISVLRVEDPITTFIYIVALDFFGARALRDAHMVTFFFSHIS